MDGLDQDLNYVRVDFPEGLQKGVFELFLVCLSWFLEADGEERLEGVGFLFEEVQSAPNFGFFQDAQPQQLIVVKRLLWAIEGKLSFDFRYFLLMQIRH